MKYTPIPHSFYIRKRKELSLLIEANSIVILFSNDLMPRTGDQFFPFRQDSNLLYFSGLDQEECTVCFETDDKGSIVNEIAFIPETNELKLIWDGPRFNKEKAKKLSGIENIHLSENLETYIKDRCSKRKNIYVNTDDFFKFSSLIERTSTKRFRELQNTLVTAMCLKLSPIMEKLRPVKDEEELQQIRKAVEITKSALGKVLKNIKPNMMEYQLEAIITKEFADQGANGHAYLPIMASGKNACVLHYIKNESICREGDLLLMDFGAEYGNYAADCSRTIPVNGKFNPRQKECYEAVLRTFEAAKKMFVPGNTINKVNAEVNRLMEREMIKLRLFSQSDIDNQNPDAPLYNQYFMHGTSHFLGLDTHDVGNKDLPFEKGMVLTCEPGIYIQDENIGIRIENNLVVDECPIDLMEDFPITVEEIETCIANRI